MKEKKTDATAGDTPAENAPETPAPQAAEPAKPVTNWPFWVTKLKADGPLARGACASLKIDWDAEITEPAFKEALEKFGGKKIAWRK